MITSINTLGYPVLNRTQNTDVGNIVKTISELFPLHAS